MFKSSRLTSMELNEYQERAMETCLNSSMNPLYMLFGLQEEVGELCGKYSKPIRKGQIEFNKNQVLPMGMSEKEMSEWNDLVDKEIGDCLWMLAGLCYVRNKDLEEIARKNLDKLAKRKENGTIEGNGDGVTQEERKC